MTKETNGIEKNEVKNDVNEVKHEAATQLYVTRKAFGKSKDGSKIVYDYFVEESVKITHPVTKEKIEMKVKANLQPADIGGYDLIDLIFSAYGNSAPLLVKPYEFDGNKGLMYEVAIINADTGEIELSVSMKPKASSDKSILNNILNKVV